MLIFMIFIKPQCTSIKKSIVDWFCRLELNLMIRWYPSFSQIPLFVTSLNQLQRKVYKDCVLNKASGFHVTQQLQPSRHSFCYILYLRQSPCWEGIHVQGLLSAYKINQAKTTSFKRLQRTFRSLQTTEAYLFATNCSNNGASVLPINDDRHPRLFNWSMLR